MGDNELRVPTARECMAEAYRELRMADGEPERVAQWIAMARELREEALMRMSAQSIVNQATICDEHKAQYFYSGYEAGKAESDQPVPVPAPVDDPTDSMAGYSRGQTPSPTAVQFAYAGRVRQSILNNRIDEVFPGLTEDHRDAIHDLINEIEDRYTAEASPARRFTLNERVVTQQYEEGGAEDEDDGSDYHKRLDEMPTLAAGGIIRPYISETQWDRAKQPDPLDVTQVMQPRFPDPPIEGAEGRCRNHEQDGSLIYMQGAWRHVSTMQRLCPIPGQTPEGDETYHRFANPL
jgi:hypothetical protein